eukprot:2596517-Pleurochrysis_carterae.AAC.2
MAASHSATSKTSRGNNAMFRCCQRRRRQRSAAGGDGDNALLPLATSTGCKRQRRRRQAASGNKGGARLRAAATEATRSASDSEQTSVTTRPANSGGVNGGALCKQRRQ